MAKALKGILAYLFMKIMEIKRKRVKDYVSHQPFCMIH